MTFPQILSRARTRKLRRATLMLTLPVMLAGVGETSAQTIQTRPTLAGLQASIDCLGLPTKTLVVPVMAYRSYLPNGTSISSSYHVGRFLLSSGTVVGPLRNLLIFDLHAQPETGSPEQTPLNSMDLVVGAELSIVNPPDGFRSDGSDTLTLGLNRISGSISALMSGQAGAQGYIDLADGPVYGSYVASAQNNGGGRFTFSLDNHAVRDINRSLQRGFSDQFEPFKFAIGGSLSNLSEAANNAYFLAPTGARASSLVINVKRYSSANCPMPSDTQYQ